MVRVVRIIVHCYHDVVAVVEAASMHVAHEINESVVVAEKHVNCNDQLHFNSNLLQLQVTVR